jgi:hypothetical protein
MFGIQMQHDVCDVAPVGILRIRVEQSQICDDVFLVVNGQYGIGGRGIGDIGIKRRLLHVRSRNGCSSINSDWAPWRIDDRTREFCFALMNGRCQLGPSDPKGAKATF